jgi:PTS system nitrogen regulatory IIA component
MNIGDWLDRSAIAPRINAAGKRQALAAVAELAVRCFGAEIGDAEAVLDALLEREQEGSTGVGHGVAVPHARFARLTRMRGVFVRLDPPVEFDSVDEQPVDLMFALFAPSEAGSEHLRALARVSRLLRKPELREQLREAHSADAIYALLVQEAETSAA